MFGTRLQPTNLPIVVASSHRRGQETAAQEQSLHQELGHWETQPRRWRKRRWIPSGKKNCWCGAFLSHGGTPSYHPFLDGMSPYKPTSGDGGTPIYGNPHVDVDDVDVSAGFLLFSVLRFFRLCWILSIYFTDVFFWFVNWNQCAFIVAEPSSRYHIHHAEISSHLV